VFTNFFYQTVNFGQLRNHILQDFTGLEILNFYEGQ